MHSPKQTCSSSLELRESLLHIEIRIRSVLACKTDEYITLIPQTLSRPSDMTKSQHLPLDVLCLETLEVQCGASAQM